MIKLVKVNENNFYQIIKMKLPENQDKYVANNLYSLAQAWLYYKTTKPFVVMNDNEIVGFIMLEWDKEERSVGIWRFMIDYEKQNKGYGRKTMELVIKMAKKSKDIDFMYLDYVKGNEVARNLYYSLGFRETGDIEEGEIIMKMNVNDNPKLVIMLAADEINEIQKILKGHNIEVTDEKLNEKIENDQVYRISLYGDTIAIYIDKVLYIDNNHQTYFDEITKMINDKFNKLS